MLVSGNRRTALRLVLSITFIAVAAIVEQFVPVSHNEQNVLAVFADIGRAISGDDRGETVYEVLSVIELPQTTTHTAESGQPENTIRISYAE